MLILDLNSDEDPLWQQYDSYYGQDFAWCMLHNYGEADRSFVKSMTPYLSIL